MHRIERLSSTTRSSVRNQIYRVLAQYASGGNHGPISVKKLFLMTADGLVDSGTIKRPDFLGGRGLGGQKFVQLAEGRQPKVFPDYGIPSDIANLMRQTFWEFFLQGILAPAPKRNPLEDSIYPEKHQDFWLYLDYVMLTPYGVQILIDSKNRIQVHDPDGYLTNFWGASPPPDNEMMRYLSECVAVFRGGHLLASVVLLGVASERLIEVLAKSLRDALGDPTGTRWFQTKYSNKRDISTRFNVLSGKLMQEYGEALRQQKLKDGFQGVVTLTFEEIRLARNDIAHPTDRQFTWNEVSGFLHNFVQYFRYINAIIAFLKNNP
jgi:hypothetical protein